MKLIGKSKLQKLKVKNLGNQLLCKEVDELISEIELKSWDNEIELKQDRKDADCVHRDGFYFFNISIHRTLILIKFEEDGDAEVVWVGNHQDYEKTFKNNKRTIEKWLRSKNYI